MSLCGSERNYLRCEDLPFVITHLDEKHDLMQLNQISSIHWSFHFDPLNLYHNKKNEKLYYLFEDKQIIETKQAQACHDDPKRLKHLDKLPCRIALVKSDICVQLMKKAQILLGKKDDKDPLYKFEYKSKFYDLNNDLVKSKADELLKKFSADPLNDR